MDNDSTIRGLPALLPVLALLTLLAATPDAVSAAAVQDSPCPATIDIGGETATLTGYICGSATASVGTPGPISVGVTVGHCTGCECGYVFDGPAGSQFARRAAGECGWGSPGGGGSSVGEDQSKLQDDQGDGGEECRWGEDYLGWGERGGC